MSGMFAGALTFNSDISNWDVSNVTNMSGMFTNTNSFNQNISDWDVSNVENMFFIFREAYGFNQNLSSWEVDAVTSCGNYDENTSAWILPKPVFNNCTP